MFGGVLGVVCFVFFFNDTATTEIYTLSLHDALPISGAPVSPPRHLPGGLVRQAFEDVVMETDAQGAVHLAPLGTLAARAGMIPAEALRPEPVPGLPPPGGRYPAVRDLDLGLHV